MNGILEQLESPKFKATKSDKILMDYLKKNLQEAPYKPIASIAKECEIAEATITRFARKMGFGSLQEFKLALAQEVTAHGKRHIIDSGIENDESAAVTAKKLLGVNIANLENTVDMLQSGEIERCSRMLAEARRVYFIGMGYSGIIAQDSNYKFMRIGLNCASFENSHTMMMIAAIMEPEDLIVAISHSGETEEIIQTARMAKENGARVISLTENKKSRLKALSDVHLGYVSGETMLETGSISSKMAQFFMMDLVYTQAVKELAGGAVEKKIKTARAIQRLKAGKA